VLEMWGGGGTRPVHPLHGSRRADGADPQHGEIQREQIRFRCFTPLTGNRFPTRAEHGCAARGRVRTGTYTAFPRADTFARMPKKRAYVETTIPNFYYDFRESPAVASRREATRRWWPTAAERYDLVTSMAVVDELSAGTSNMTGLRLSLLAHLPKLPLLSAVGDIVQVYLENKLMPAKPSGDALHLALASFFECDLIVTWNCRHLANPNKAEHIRRVNARLELGVPTLVTPLELLKEEFQ
jgi:hypothetical protein